jgi:hypothetical protein
MKIKEAMRVIAEEMELRGLPCIYQQMAYGLPKRHLPPVEEPQLADPHDSEDGEYREYHEVQAETSYLIRKGRDADYCE